jgi:hypothetical protein
VFLGVGLVLVSFGDSLASPFIRVMTTASVDVAHLAEGVILVTEPSVSAR